MRTSGEFVRSMAFRRSFHERLVGTISYLRSGIAGFAQPSDRQLADWSGIRSSKYLPAAGCEVRISTSF